MEGANEGADGEGKEIHGVNEADTAADEEEVEEEDVLGFTMEVEYSGVDEDEEEASNFKETSDDEPELFGDAERVDAREVHESVRRSNTEGNEDAGGTAPTTKDGESFRAARKDAVDCFVIGGRKGSVGDELETEEPESDNFESISEGDDSGSDAPKRPRYKQFREEDLQGTVVFEKKLQFNDIWLLKKALKLYCIQNHFDYHYIKNDKLRVIAKCKGGCA